ncbi:MAG: NAD(P)/FAD-dependent oxidoreductase [Rhodoglobus sp.]
MKALIIGGGIAGTSTALALHKAGIDAEVFEARDTHSDGVGAFVTLAVNGLTTLRTLGLDIATVPGIPTPTMQIALGDGTRLAAFPLGPVLPDGTTSKTVRRADLYSALRAKVTAAGIPIHYGKRISSADAAANGPVTATFDDGSTATADLLIGADGLHSRTRTIIDPKAPQPHYLGILNAGGYAHGVDIPDAGTMHMIFGGKTFFSYLASGDGDTWWFANPPQAMEPGRGELAAISPEAWRGALLELVDGDAGPAKQLIDASPELFEPWPTHDFPSVPHWHRDGMIIIGDAAHAASPSSGQGASMAIEDAAVLALCLRDAPSIPAAFAAFEGIRRPRVTRIVRQGRRNGTGKTPGPFGRRIRDAFLKRIFARPPRNQDALGWIYNYPIDWTAGVVH